MKHLDPRQIETAKIQPVVRKSSVWRWLGATMVFSIALGAVATMLFLPNSDDRVTEQEKQERQIAFTKVRELSVSPVDVSQMDSVLDDMRLAPAERLQLRALLGADGGRQDASHATSDGNRPSVGAIAALGLVGPKPMRLASVDLWDSHAQDGDVVAVVSGGYQREVMLMKAPQTVTFPVDQSGIVQFVGVKDGGGGITLGIRGPSQEILMPIMSEGQALSLPVGR